MFVHGIFSRAYQIAKDACLLECEDDNKSQLVEAFFQQFQEDLISKSQEVQKNASDTVKQHSTSVLADKRLVGSKNNSGSSILRPMGQEVNGKEATHVSDEANKSRHFKRRKSVPSVIGLKKMLSATDRDALIRSLKSSKRKKATDYSSKSSSRDKKGTSLTAGSGSTDKPKDSKDWQNWITLHGDGGDKGGRVREARQGGAVNYSYKPSVGASVGIITMWDASVVDVRALVNLVNCLIVQGKFLKNNVDFCLANVYALCDNRGRQVLWNELSGMIRRISSVAWCVVRSSDERKSRAVNNSIDDVSPFNQFIDGNFLIDLPLCGRKFTWYLHDGSAMSRLDRVLLSDGWITLFPNCVQAAMPRGLSDHCPVLLTIDEQNWGPKPLRMLKCWADILGKYPNGRLVKARFKDGVEEFITYAMSQDIVKREGGIRCPCVKCMCGSIESPEEVFDHLEKFGFMNDYYVWIHHGERVPANINTDASSSGAQAECGNFGRMQEMVGDALGVNMSYEGGSEEEIIPNDKALKFYAMMEEVNKPLFEGASDSKLSMSVRLLAAKSNWNRLFASMKTASQMTWHYYNKTNSNVMRHPCDGLAWKHFDAMHPDFVEDPRNVRLGLCYDGFTPYVQASPTPYSCWPVIVTPYNLPPDMCMTKPYMFLSCIIPGPSNPTDGIHVYLQPLIDDLKRLWIGELTYDIARKENFTMRAAMMWTINDFPAYGMLSGWSTHGKLVCPHCMKHTKSSTLKKGGKASWFDCHRSGLCKFPDVGKRNRYDGYGESHNWTKRSIFWDLPYWKDNLRRHNLDVMHIEKNFCDNILHPVMDVIGKTKDNEKARCDLSLYCKRPKMELKLLPNDKYLKPKAIYSLTSDEAKSVCQWLKELRMPDGYSSNLARCSDVNTGRLRGMKSHDSHVLMERLLPISFCSLPNHVLNPLTEVSQFFKDLCASTLRMDELFKMDQNIPIILCKLEQIPPPPPRGFFDSMEHVTVHLAYEAMLGGPVQYRKEKGPNTDIPDIHKETHIKKSTGAYVDQRSETTQRDLAGGKPQIWFGKLAPNAGHENLVHIPTPKERSRPVALPPAVQAEIQRWTQEL
ncbi:hypothetical protein TSUD_288910 [Trifolium subterraneum]|uniref:DUF4218 domain-containing protein n=1 Tax=Trifolium subterraneum TaxID=3900 RepID=A0A2Z6NPV5_TRISU|nr:hypothetical protein TSUD_288910 [Trifolium subterraneum]